MTSGRSGTEGIVTKAWSTASVGHGGTRTGTAASTRGPSAGVRATTSCARLRDVPDLNFDGELRLDHDRSGPRRYRITSANIESAKWFTSQAYEGHTERVEGYVSWEYFDYRCGAGGMYLIPPSASISLQN